MLNRGQAGDSQRQGPGQGGWQRSTAPRAIQMLIEATRTLRLNESNEFSEFVRRISMTGNERAAEKCLRMLAPALYRQQLQPDQFLSLEQNLGGDINLGTLPNGQPFGLDRQQLVRHTGIFGQSGGGKSNTLKHVVYQTRDAGIFAIHIDRKGDLEHAVRDGIDSVHWSELRLNPLCPLSYTVDIREYRNDFAKLWGDLFQFFARGLSIFLLALDQLYSDFHVYDRWGSWDWKHMRFPTLHDLLNVLKSAQFRRRVRGQGVESLLSSCDKLESLIVEIEPVVSCQRGFDLVRLFKERRPVNINLDGISVEYQNFVIVTLLLQYAHYFRAHGPRNELNVLLMFDECKGLLGKKRENFTIQDLVSKVRELGIGLVVADQIPSEISQFMFSNIGTLVMFRHSDGVDLQRLMYSMGCTPQQIRENYSLQPGEAIVRSMKAKDLHKIRVPFLPAEKFISRDEVQRLMASRVEELNGDVIAAVHEQPAKGASPAGLDEQEKAFLQCLARNFDRPASEVYKELGLGESAGFRIKDRLVKQKMITQVTTSLGKDGKRAVFLVPNPMVFEDLGIDLGSGRGKPLHKHFQSGIKAQAEKLGFTARVEDCANGTSAGPDIGLEKDGRRVAVEVCVTSKPSTEASNVGKNRELGFDYVILAFVHKQALERTKELVSARHDDNERQRVRFCLVYEVRSALEGL